MYKMIEKKDVWRTLKTNFTEKEKLIMGEQIAGCIRERNRLEEELSSVKKQYASDIGKQNAEISSLAERFNTGWEMRRVECEEIKDFNNGTVTVYRKSTDLQPAGYTVEGWRKLFLVEERAMTGEERQQNLPLGEKKEALADEGEGFGSSGIASAPSIPGSTLGWPITSPSECSEFCAKTEEVPGTLPPPVGIPSQDAQDEQEEEFLPESMVMVGSETIKGFNALKTPENELSEDQNPFYQSESFHKKSVSGRKKKNDWPRKGGKLDLP